MSTIEKEIQRAAPTVFRRAYVKRRRASDALYEASWVEITPYVKRWGALETSVDDVRLNRFRQADLTLICRNDTGAFGPESQRSSLWSGYLTRVRSLIKVEAGYVAPDGTEYPADPCLGVWLLDGEIVLDTVRNEACLKGVGLTNIFETVRASEVTGIGATLTASEIVAKIRDHTDGSGTFVFRQMITSTSWTIQSTTNLYDIYSTTSVEDKSTWDLMNDLAEAEGFVIIATRGGGLEFRDRNARTTTSQLALYGEGYPRPNVIRINSRKEAVNKYFSVIRVKYDDVDTTTSWVRAGTSTAIRPDSLAWKYGNKELEILNPFILNTNTAQGIADNLYNAFSVVAQEYEVVCKFLPQLEISDRVDLNWTSLDVMDSTTRWWDTEDWASDTAVAVRDGLSWDPEKGENFDLVQEPMIVLKKRTDLDQFTTTLTLREVN